MADRDGREVMIMDRSTGEMHRFADMVPDLAEAEPPELAALVEEIELTITDMGTLREAALGELLRELDRSGEWTKRYGNPEDGVQYEVKAPSPTAGVDGYDDIELEGILRELIAEQLINEAGAGKALKRTITLELGVPLAEDLEQLSKVLSEAREIRIAGVAVAMLKATPSRAVSLPGVKAIAKVEGIAERLAAAYRKRTPSRRAKVTAIRKPA